MSGTIHIQHTIACLFIGVSLLVSGCSNTPPQTVITPNQTIPNATIPQPPPAPNATLNNSTTTPPAGNTTVAPIPAPNITPTPPPAPNITANTTPPPPVPAPNTTQNTTPIPAPVPTPNATPDTTPNTTPNETQALVSYSNKVQKLFNAFCTLCHQPSDNTTTLKLDPADSYKMLVGVPSDDNPNILRVKPGAPDESYILMKLAQDPPHATPPPQQYIDVIRQWILEGALNN